MVLPPRQADRLRIGGWLLLPPAAIPLPGMPDYDKSMAIVAGVMLGTLIFQPQRLLGSVLAGSICRSYAGAFAP